MELNVNSNNINEQIKVTEYADTAYKGKADPYYRENIAGPEQRKRHLAKGQCQLGVFPRVSITGVCWDNHQHVYDPSEIKGTVHDIDHKLDIQPEQLRLAMHSLSQNTKEAIFLIWTYLHLGVLVVLPVYLLIGLIFGGWDNLLNNLDVLFIGLGGLLASKYLYRLLDKFNLVPVGDVVIFNRQMGMIEIANDERTGYHHIPFEQFNAHHRTVHNERGRPYYGFTLLHYKDDLMYQVVNYTSVENALVHWELIKNFMDTSQPLADIPLFERYRLYDPTTIDYDEKNARPTNFWCRVDKKFIKKVSSMAHDITFDFPTQKADTLVEAIRHGYKVPDIIKFPWREAKKISDKTLVIRRNWFSRYVVYPLIF